MFIKLTQIYYNPSAEKYEPCRNPDVYINVDTIATISKGSHGGAAVALIGETAELYTETLEDVMAKIENKSELPVPSVPNPSKGVSRNPVQYFKKVLTGK